MAGLLSGPLRVPGILLLYDRQLQTSCSQSAFAGERQLMFKADVGRFPCEWLVYPGSRRLSVDSSRRAASQPDEPALSTLSGSAMQGFGDLRLDL